MKSILMSIRPQFVAKILNGEKTIEIRKKFPSDYVGWVYIYCTKNGDYLMKKASGNGYITCMRSIQPKQMKYSKSVLNGKVVARFWCDKVEEIIENYPLMYKTETLNCEELEEQSHLTYDEIDNYLFTSQGYAIHITKLEIFDKPKEISEFIQSKRKNYEEPQAQKAPQSWCYIEL